MDVRSPHAHAIARVHLDAGLPVNRQVYGLAIALHGHIHESRGVTKLGSTVCINPGSSYSEGTLDGCIVTLRGNKVRSTQLIRG